MVAVIRNGGMLLFSFKFILLGMQCQRQWTPCRCEVKLDDSTPGLLGRPASAMLESYADVSQAD